MTTDVNKVATLINKLLALSKDGGATEAMRAELEFWVECGFLDFVGSVLLLAIGIPGVVLLAEWRLGW